MQETNESLGTYIKRMRDEKNVSIEQVAYATRISLKMLRALEEDNHVALPASTFVRGYLQAYAKYVRIDSQDLLLRYQHHLATAPDNKKGAIKSHYLYVRERYQEKRRLVLVIVLFATMLSVAGTYFLLKAKREKNKRLAQQADQILKNEGTTNTATETLSTAPIVVAEKLPEPKTETKVEIKAETKTETKVETKPTPPVEPPAAPTPPAKPAVVAAPPPAPTPTPPPAPPVETPLAQPVAPVAVERPKDEKKTYNLLVRAEEDVWLRFQTDQDEIRDLTLRSGKALMLRADTVIKIFSGNLGALKATMNGTPIASLAQGSRSKSVVLPEAEASKHSLPLFPQFQTKPTPPSSGEGGGAQNSATQQSNPGAPATTN